MKIKKIIALVLTFCLCFACAACGLDAKNDKDNDKNAPHKADGVAGSSVYVGKWVRGDIRNNGEPSFDEYYELTIGVGYSEYYFEFYSNGTGRTNFYGGTVCDGGGDPFMWSYNAETGKLRFTVATEEEDGGYEIHDRHARVATPKKAFIMAENDGYNQIYKELDEKIETVCFCYYIDSDQYAKVDSDEFVDNRDLGCPEAFAAIDKALAE